MNTIVYEETLTGRPHDKSVQKATSDNKMWMQFNVMPRTGRDGRTAAKGRSDQSRSGRKF